MVLTVSDIQRMADAASNSNPLIAGPGKQRIMALAGDRGRFADDEAWMWANSLARTWVAQASQQGASWLD